MLVNDPTLPNPILIIAVFAFSLAIVRVLTTTVHEMGHAVFGLLFLKGDFDVYIGSYGQPDKGKHFKVGRLRFHFIYAPFSLAEGVFVSPSQGTTYWKDFLITLGGPLASLFTAVAYAYLAIASPMPEVYKMIFYILMGSSVLDFWYNIKPSTEPIVLHNGTLVYNDGYTLKYIWSQLLSKDAAKGER
jgi:hypothetical protein